jgi:Leucine-rich repeat (LRR) protein
MPPSTLYALLLALVLVLGVGCGKEAVKTSPKEPEAKTQKADTKKKVPAVCPFCGGKFPITDILFHKLKCPQNTNDQQMKKPASGKPTEEANKPSPPKAVPVNIADPIVEKAIREELKKPEGELTKADLEKVTKVNFFGNKLTEVPKELEKLTKLTSLRLSGNKLTDVKGLEKLNQLTSLYLSGNQLISVKGLEKLNQLTKLMLEFNQLTEVKGLEKLTKLEVLYLEKNQLTKLPEGLEKLTQLKTLSLADNQLTDVKALEKLTQLTHLALHKNLLTDVPKGLEKLTQLQLLYLDDNPDLTKAQIDELKMALPKCKIFSDF